MKNYFFFFCLFTITLSAQIRKGQGFFENTFGDVYTNDAEWKQEYQGKIYTINDKIFNINADLNAGYLITKNIALGTGIHSYYSQDASVGYSQGGNKIAEGHYKDYTLMVVPFVRYYVHPDSKSSLYLQVGGGGGGNLIHINEFTNYYETGIIYTKYANNFLDHRVKTAQAAIGLNYFLNEYVAFNTAVGFNYFTVEYSDNVTSNYPLVLSSTAQKYNFTSKQKVILWRIGFSFFLGKKKENKPPLPTPGS